MGQEVSKGGDMTKFYTVHETLGKGNYAIVKKVVRKSDGKEFAVKIVKKAKLDKREMRLCRGEIVILQKLNHPNCVKMFDIFENEEKIFLVLELLRGGNLFDAVVRTGRLTEERAARAIKDVASALAYCHQVGVVHRDLKPENLMLSGSDADSTIKITDFGLSKYVTPTEAMQTCCGSPNFVAPDVLEGLPYTSQVDMWSLGVVLYVLLVGFRPFENSSPKVLFKQIRRGKYRMPAKYWDRISPAAKDLVKRLLVVDPAKRLTATEVLMHPWVSATGVAPRHALPLEHVQQLRKTQARDELRVAVEAVMALNRIGALMHHKYGHKLPPHLAGKLAPPTDAALATLGPQLKPAKKKRTGPRARFAVEEKAAGDIIAGTGSVIDMPESKSKLLIEELDRARASSAWRNFAQNEPPGSERPARGRVRRALTTDMFAEPGPMPRTTSLRALRAKKVSQLKVRQSGHRRTPSTDAMRPRVQARSRARTAADDFTVGGRGTLTKEQLEVSQHVAKTLQEIKRLTQQTAGALFAGSAPKPALVAGAVIAGTRHQRTDSSNVYLAPVDEDQPGGLQRVLSLRELRRQKHERARAISSGRRTPDDGSQDEQDEDEEEESVAPTPPPPEEDESLAPTPPPPADDPEDDEDEPEEEAEEEEEEDQAQEEPEEQRSQRSRPREDSQEDYEDVYNRSSRTQGGASPPRSHRSGQSNSPTPEHRRRSSRSSANMPRTRPGHRSTRSGAWESGGRPLPWGGAGGGGGGGSHTPRRSSRGSRTGDAAPPWNAGRAAASRTDERSRRRRAERERAYAGSRDTDVQSAASSRGYRRAKSARRTQDSPRSVSRRSRRVDPRIEAAAREAGVQIPSRSPRPTSARGPTRSRSQRGDNWFDRANRSKHMRSRVRRSTTQHQNQNGEFSTRRKKREQAWNSHFTREKYF